MDGGEGGIRTHVTISREHAFQACSFSHSDTSPRQACHPKWVRDRWQEKSLRSELTHQYSIAPGYGPFTMRSLPGEAPWPGRSTCLNVRGLGLLERDGEFRSIARAAGAT